MLASWAWAAREVAPTLSCTRSRLMAGHPGYASRTRCTTAALGGRIETGMSASKHLFVLRHAKSSWDDPGLDDHERPLAPRGRRAAEAMAAHMSAHGVEPELVCSSSRRTRETLAGVAVGGEHVIERELYGAST